MSLSMYQASIPVFVRGLANLSHILTKGAENAKSRGIDEIVLVNDRLAPDMLPLSRQVQIACDSAVRGAARLAQMDIPSMPDTETTFDELQARIAKASAFVNSVPADKIDGGEAREIVLPMRQGEVKFTGQTFLLNFSLPNFYFHVTTAYAILRHNGADIGKPDYIGALG